MTQPDHGLKARLDADDFGKSPFANKHEIALYDAWQSGQLITLSDHEAAVKAAERCGMHQAIDMIEENASLIIAPLTRDQQIELMVNAAERPAYRARGGAP